MPDIYVKIIIGALCLIVGYLIGKFWDDKETFDGTIVIEPGEDDREVMRWVLDMELDDISQKEKILFKVENHLSQK